MRKIVQRHITARSLSEAAEKYASEQGKRVTAFFDSSLSVGHPHRLKFEMDHSREYFNVSSGRKRDEFYIWKET